MDKIQPIKPIQDDSTPEAVAARLKRTNDMLDASRKERENKSTEESILFTEGKKGEKRILGVPIKEFKKPSTTKLTEIANDRGMPVMPEFNLKTMFDGDFRLPRTLRDSINFGNHATLKLRVINIDKGKSVTIKIEKA